MSFMSWCRFSRSSTLIFLTAAKRDSRGRKAFCTSPLAPWPTVRMTLTSCSAICGARQRQRLAPARRWRCTQVIGRRQAAQGTGRRAAAESVQPCPRLRRIAPPPPSTRTLYCCIAAAAAPAARGEELAAGPGRVPAAAIMPPPLNSYAWSDL